MSSAMDIFYLFKDNLSSLSILFADNIYLSFSSDDGLQKQTVIDQDIKIIDE